MNIAIVGAGYVGLVSAACFAELGYDVTCIDKDERKIGALQAGQVTIFEPGLERLIANGQRSGRLTFTQELAPVVGSADIVFIAVGTPSRPKEDAADLSFVFAAAEEIAKALSGFTLIVIKSTVPVGTAERIREIIHAENPGAQFAIASNPEFLREGTAVDDFLKPDRIVIGVGDERAAELMAQLYRPLTRRDVALVVTSCRTAELIKYAANSYLATRIGFVNQMADLCEAAGCDIQDLARGMGLDKRIGQHYLHPGPGLGGSCFPKDTRALVVMAREFGAPVSIVEQVVTSNERRKRTLVDRIRQAVGGNLKGRRIALLGIAFKADTDDVRESAALVLIPALNEEGTVLAAYDPKAMDHGRAHFDDVQWCADPYSAVIGADAAVILTEWNEFRGLNLAKIASRMAEPLLIDLKNLFEPRDVASAGLTYVSLGRPVRRGIVPEPKLLAVGGGR